MSAEDMQRPILVGGERLRRKVDRVNSGGGDKYHPRTSAEAGKLLAPMVSDLASDLELLSAEAVGTLVYFQMTVLPNYLAASYFPSHLFSEAGLAAVGSRATWGTYKTRLKSEQRLTKSIIVAGTTDSTTRLSALITSNGTGGKSQQNAFDQLREISEVRLSSYDEILSTTRQDVTVWEAVLNPQVDLIGDLVPTDNETFEKWVAWVEHLDGRVISDYRRNEAGLTFVPVRLNPDKIRKVSEFNPLRSMRPMPIVRPTPPGLLRSFAPAPRPPVSTTPEGEHTIAIFDGGIRNNAFLGAVAMTDLTTEPENYDDTSHGIAVTGAAIYGSIKPEMRATRPASNAHHFRILPEPPDDQDVYSYWVLDQIEKVLQEMPFRIVNLSLGPDVSVEDSSEPNLWTSSLDRISYGQDVLFVVAAGNNGEEDDVTGLNRVQTPADMANGLSVGACDAMCSPKWERTPYSAIGPGRNGSRIQPNGVQFGGDLRAGKPFYALHDNRRMSEAQGTSFAGPIVANSLSRLGTLLGSEWKSASTLRAFATHFAERHPDGDIRLETGHGRFELDYEQALECKQHEVHLLYQDTIGRNDPIALDLPVPRSVVSGKVALRVTMAFASSVEPTQALEYTQATIEQTFRPHSQKFRFFNKVTKKNLIIDIRDDENGATELSKAGYEISGHPVSRPIPGSSGNEVELREGGKWETVRRIDLSMNAASLFKPRLDLSYVARKEGLLHVTAPPLSFALLVSVSAPKTKTLYDDVVAEFQLLNRLGLSMDVTVKTKATT